MSIKKLLFCSSGLLCLGMDFANTATATEVTEDGVITTITVNSSVKAKQSASVDFTTAMPLPLPQVTQNLSELSAGSTPTYPGSSGHVDGKAGDGEKSPVTIPLSGYTESNTEISSQESGTLNHPYTTALVNASGTQTSRQYPYSPTGKLYFKIGSDTYICSASLIKPGIIVTAAHCVAEFGASSVYSDWVFIPALNGSKAPYGKWDVAEVKVLTAYLNGTDSCAFSGVVCKNDMALLRLKPKTTASGNSYYAGDKAGYYSYAWNGYGYANFLGLTSTQISQLGYPHALNNGTYMQRTDSLGYVDSRLSGNTVIGSLQTGGSSGGPWLVNLGLAPEITGSASFGADSSHNVLVGVTSWGYDNDPLKEQGASPFTSENIVSLVNAMCPSTSSPGCS